MPLLTIFTFENLLIAVAAFVLGALVFRNNPAKGDKLVNKVKNEF